MTYRAVFTADLHVSNALPYAWRGDEVETDRLGDTIAVLDQMADHADRAKATDLWFIGDLIDRRLLDAVTHRTVAAKLVELVDEREKELILIPGNHEAGDSAGSAYTLDGFARLRPGKIHVWNGPTTWKREGVTFHGLPYKPDAVAQQLVEDIRDNLDPGFLLLHQSLKGGKAGEWVCPDGIPPEALQGFLGVLAGHFHTVQEVGNALYLGAAVQHHFGDAGEPRGFWDMKFTPKGMEREFIESRAPRFHMLRWECSGDPPRIGTDVLTPGDYVQLDVVGTKAQLQARLKDANERARDLEGLGARLAKVRPLMVAERKTRAKVSDEGGKVTWPSAVDGYLDVCALEGLERHRLAEIGKAALAEAELAR